MKNRSPDQTVVSISIPKDLLAQIDARAKSLGMPRSRYLAFLARTDVAQGGEWMLRPASDGSRSLDLAAEVAEFLELAVPALADYEERRKSAPTDTNASEAVETEDTPADNRFWSDFLRERDEILRLKWIESEKAKRDIGYRMAIKLWLEHRPLWLAAQLPESP